VTGTTATGTGQAGAGITVRDAAGRVVATAVVGEDGTWTLEAELVCDTDYTVSQTVDGIESDATEFSTAACAVTPGNGGTKNPVGGGLAATGGENLTGVAIGALLALLAGAGSILFARRRRA
ncbi:MAG: Ig-like domain-containing protein, partial [Microbacterium sp.]